MKIILLKFSIICLLLLSPFTVTHAGQGKVEEVVQDKETRSTILAADGYSFFSEDKTINNMRKEAETDARRKVIEDAHMHIKSMTKIENFELTYDIVESISEASLRVIERKDYGIEENRRYHVWMKAEVRYTLKPPETVSEQSILMNKKAPLTVKVWTDKKSYRDGEEMKIYVEGNKPFYGKILYQTASGEIIQVLPNKYRGENYFRELHRYIIPHDNDSFVLAASKPYGAERIILYASTSPLGALESQDFGNGLLRIRGSLDTISKAVRDINIENNEALPIVELYEAEWQLKISR